MGKVTIGATLLSTVVLLITFFKGMLVLRGGADRVMSHLQWSVATLIIVLAANVIAMVHAARADRLINELRAARDRDRARTH